MTSIDYIRRGIAELPVGIIQTCSVVQLGDPHIAELGLGIWPDARIHLYHQEIVRMGRHGKLHSSLSVVISATA